MQITGRAILGRVGLHLVGARSHLLVYGSTQATILLAALLRMPLASEVAPRNALGEWLFWTTVPGLVSAVAAGRVSGTMADAARGGLLVRIPARRSVLFTLVIALILLVGQVWISYPSVVGGSLPSLFGATLLWTSATRLGFHLGLGGARAQFVASGAGAILSLLFTAVAVDIPAAHSTGYRFVLIQTSISLLPAVAPALVAWVQTWKAPMATSQSQQMPFRESIGETLATLPPAFNGALDGLVLLTFGLGSLLATYGIERRLGLITTAIPAALYAPCRIALARQSPELRWRDSTRLAVGLTILQIPLIAIFASLASPFVSFLSSETARADTLLTVSICLVGLTVPAWIAISAGLAADDSARVRLGQLLIGPLLVGNFLCLPLTGVLGVSGPVLGTWLTYVFALTVGIRLLSAQRESTA